MAPVHVITYLDQQLFLWLNNYLHTAWLDGFFVFLTTKQNWLIPGIIGIMFVVLYEKKQAPAFLLMLLIAVVLSDQLSSGVLKPWVGRLRPCKTLEGFRLLIPCGGRWSFPSSHAANAAAVATLLAWRYPTGRWVFGLLALLIGYSRIYVGVHYPLDVLGGWTLGVICAVGVIRGSVLMQTRLLRMQQQTGAPPEG